MRIRDLFCNAAALLASIMAICMLSQCASSAKTVTTSSVDGLPMSKPGACYARCLLPAVYEMRTDTFYVYTGDSSGDFDNVDLRTIELHPAKEEWKSVKVKDDCSDPDDCMSKRRFLTPAETLTLPIVLDTSQTVDYEQRIIEREVVVEDSNFTEWAEVVCDNDFTEDLVADVQAKLKERGYLKECIEGKMDEPTKEALIVFQQANGLRRGVLDIDTLNELGVKY